MSAALTMLNERLQLYLDAEKAILEGNQSWSSPAGMTYTRANLTDLRIEIKSLRAEIAVLSQETGSNYNAQSFVFGGR